MRGLVACAFSLGAVASCGGKTELSRAHSEPDAAVAITPSLDAGVGGQMHSGTSDAGVALDASSSTPVADASSPPPRPGTLDETFGDGGVVYGTFRGRHSDVRDMTVQSDGKVVLVGCAWDSLSSPLGTVAFAVSRLLSDGSPDLEFGEAAVGSARDGHVLSQLSRLRSCAQGIALWNDGRMLVGGFAETDTGSHFASAMYTADGALDAAFGGVPYGLLAGTVITEAGGWGESIFAVGVQPEQQPVVVGRRIGAKLTPGFAAFRFDARGALDGQFRFSGDAAKLGDAASLWLPTDSEALAVQRDGKLLIAGMHRANGYDNIALIRLLADGTLDADFARGASESGGIVTTDLGARSWPTAIRMDPWGRILVAGAVNPEAADAECTLTRYTSGGIIDSTFGEGGIARMRLGSACIWRDIAVAEDGKVLALRADALARFTRDGLVDLEFGDNGVLNLNFSASEIAIGPHGKIVVAGMIATKDSWRFVAARVWP